MSHGEGGGSEKCQISVTYYFNGPLTHKHKHFEQRCFGRIISLLKLNLTFTSSKNILVESANSELTISRTISMSGSRIPMTRARSTTDVVMTLNRIAGMKLEIISDDDDEFL
jgi:hypothetical protein